MKGAEVLMIIEGEKRKRMTHLWGWEEKENKNKKRQGARK